MTKIRLALLAAVASGVIGGGFAYAAGGNDAAVRQNGNDNTVTIDQSGGTDNQFNSTGSSDTSAALQDGDSNTIVATQSGDGNQIGLTGNQFDTIHLVTGNVGGTGLNRAAWNVPAAGYDSDANTGVAQIGDDNSLTVTQTSNSNVVGGVVQLTVDVGTGQKNTLTLTQGSGDGNQINQVLQAAAQGSQNTATITQTGAGNVLNAVNQIGLNVNGSGGNENKIDATFIGSSNGTTGLSGYAAVSTRVKDSELNQMGENNYIKLDISGDDNRLWCYSEQLWWWPKHFVRSGDHRRWQQAWRFAGCQQSIQQS